MAEGISVRGTNCRGAKDAAILGGIIFESMACDGQYHKCEITSLGRFKEYESDGKNVEQRRQALGIKEGTGTVATLTIDPPSSKVPKYDDLRDNLRQLVALRDILQADDREVRLIDNKSNRNEILKSPAIEGHKCLNEPPFQVPGYEGAWAKLIIKRAKQRFDDKKSRFRMGGILIKSKHAIHEATLFAPELERDPHAQWFYGRLTCEYLDDLWNEYDKRVFEKHLQPEPANPRPIFDPLRKEGLSREHPFVQALFEEALEWLRPLVEKERKQAENQEARIESDSTRKRLRALEKAATQFMRENRSDEEDESARNVDSAIPDSIFEKKGFSLNPPFAQIVLGHSVRFWLNIKQAAFPEFSVGDEAEITCLSDDISASRRFIGLEMHPVQEGVLRCVWSVKGEKVTKASGVKVRVGSIVRESLIEVLESEREKYRDIHEFCFQRKRYTVQVGANKTIILLAPCPGVVPNRMPFELICSDPVFKISGDKVLIPRPELGIAISKLKVTASASDRNAELTASIAGRKCKTQLISADPSGFAMKIELKDEEPKDTRSYWVRGTNTLHVCTRHPSLRRYLGPPPEFAGQEEKHFRVLLAEIVTEAVCQKILSKNVEMRPEEYSEADWPAYYAEYSKLMTKFLPIAHETQLKI
ncbi:MAG: hypothetical protein HY747_04075 [Elusimicrobia bacterium]|nr:hypothetical protein [Elusimicrobiota bacterium]